MGEITIYHNGICSKSRGALEILMDGQIPHTVRWYLAEPLTVDELSSLLLKLGMQPSDLVRKSEPLYLENYAGRDITEDKWLTILQSHPELIERPIVETTTTAIIARPPQSIYDILPKNNC